MSEIRKRMMSDERAHGECVGMNHAEDEIARLQAENDVLAQRLAAVEKERDAFERKGKDLCIAHGNALVTIHDLQTEHARLTEELAQYKKWCEGTPSASIWKDLDALKIDHARLRGEREKAEQHVTRLVEAGDMMVRSVRYTSGVSWDYAVKNWEEAKALAQET